MTALLPPLTAREHDTEPIIQIEGVNGSATFAIADLPDGIVELLARENRGRRRRKAPSRLSMSTMRRGEACELSMFLQRDTGDVAGAPAVAGRAFHEVAAAVNFRAQMTGQATMPVEKVVSIAKQVLTRINDPIRHPEREAVLEWAASWAMTAAFPVHADEWYIEQLWTRDVDFHILSARLDSVARTDTIVEIEDYKTGQPPRDPGYIYEAFQPRNYAWHAAHRFPDAETFIVTERFPRTGRLYTVMYDREDCETWIDEWLRALALRLGRAWASGRFTAQPGSWCARCPAPDRCSLPEAARPMSLTVPEKMQRSAELLKVREADVKQRRETLKTLCDVLGVGIIVGDERLGFVDKTKHEVMTVTEARQQGREAELRDAKAAIEDLKVDHDRPEFRWTKVKD